MLKNIKTTKLMNWEEGVTMCIKKLRETELGRRAEWKKIQKKNNDQLRRRMCIKAKRNTTE